MRITTINYWDIQAYVLYFINGTYTLPEGDTDIYLAENFLVNSFL